MKTLRIVALVLLILACIGFILTMQIYLNAKVSVQGVRVASVVPANESEKFEQDLESLKHGTLRGRVFKNVVDDNQAYHYITYELSVKNGLWQNIQAVEVQAVPKTQDLWQEPVPMVNLNAKKEKAISVVVLSAGEPNGTREFYVTYYVWGVPLKIKYVGRF